MSQPGENPSSVPRLGYGFTFLLLLLLIGGFIFIQSDYFLLRHIEIIGHCHVAKAELLDRVGLNQKINIFQIDLKRLRKQILLIPQIEKVKIQRCLPGTLKLYIVERTPLCLIEYQKDLLEVGVDGVIIEKRNHDDPIKLPVVTGLRQANLSDTELTRVNDSRYWQGVKILTAAGQKLQGQLSEVDLIHNRLYTVDSIQVDLGNLYQINNKMNSLSDLLTSNDRKQIVEIDLRVPSQPVILTDHGVSKQRTE